MTLPRIFTSANIPVINELNGIRKLNENYQMVLLLFRGAVISHLIRLQLLSLHRLIRSYINCSERFAHEVVDDAQFGGHQEKL